MNSQITFDLILKFVQAIRQYLVYNTEYRRAQKNPERKQALKQARATAYGFAQEANTALHTHLLAFKEPDFIRSQARELISRWDARNTCYENLIHLTADDNPREAIIRLDKAESRLRDHLKAITEIISKLQS